MVSSCYLRYLINPLWWCITAFLHLINAIYVRKAGEIHNSAYILVITIPHPHNQTLPTQNVWKTWIYHLQLKYITFTSQVLYSGYSQFQVQQLLLFAIHTSPIENQYNQDAECLISQHPGQIKDSTELSSCALSASSQLKKHRCPPLPRLPWFFGLGGPWGFCAQFASQEYVDPIPSKQEKSLKATFSCCVSALK